MRALILKRMVESVDRVFDGETAGGVEVGLGGGMNGVAGERCVASTWLLERREQSDEKDPREEPRAEGKSASEIVGLLCGSKADCSVGSSSSIASSSLAGTDLSTGGSESVKPR